MNSPKETSPHVLPLMVLCALALTLSTAGCRRSDESAGRVQPQLPTKAVRVQKVETQAQPWSEEIVGTVRARVTATVEAKVAGKIVVLPVAVGQRVRAGERLVQVDAAEIRAHKEQADAVLQQAERDWTRVSSLFAQQAATRVEQERSETTLRGARAAVQEAVAMLGYVDVLAPFDGVITRKWVEIGDLASPGKPLLALEDDSRLQVEAEASENASGVVRLDARFPVRVDRGAGEVGEFVGVVAEVAPNVDPMSRTLRIKLDIEKSTGLTPGQFVRVALPLGDRPSLSVPQAALLERGQLELVFVVVQGRAEMHLVKTGRREGGRVEVLSGLRPGETVVVEGAAELVDGQPVEVR